MCDWVMCVCLSASFFFWKPLYFSYKIHVIVFACVLFAGVVRMCVVNTHCLVGLCFATRGKQSHLSAAIHHVEDI